MLDPNGLVFRSPQGQVIRGSQFHRRVWQPALREAGLEGVRVHDLRHTAVAFWIDAGANAPEIAARAGHRTQTIMDRYRHILPTTADRLNERLDVMFRATVPAVQTPSVPSTGDSPTDSADASCAPAAPHAQEGDGAAKGNPPPDQPLHSWALQDSNLRPLPCKGSALPLS